MNLIHKSNLNFTYLAKKKKKNIVLCKRVIIGSFQTNFVYNFFILIGSLFEFQIIF